MNDSEAGTSGSVMEEFDVFLNHRGPDVKATFVAHLEDALLCAGFRPFLDIRALKIGGPALTSIDQALAQVKVHVAVVSRGYAASKYCLDELVAIMKSGKPVVPVFFGVEIVDLQSVEEGLFAKAFEEHKVLRRSERMVQKWRDALAALAKRTGFRLADYESDEARLKREVVNAVARLTPSNQRVKVEEYRVGLECPTIACIKLLGSMGHDGVGILGLVGLGGVGKTTLAREIYNHYAGLTDYRFMTFLELHQDVSSLDVQVRLRHHGNLREQLLWDLLRVQGNEFSYDERFKRVSELGPVFIVIDDVHCLGEFQQLIPSLEFLCPGSRVIITSRDGSVVNNFVDRAKGLYVYNVPKLGVEDAIKLFNLHAFHSKDAPEDYKSRSKTVVEACEGLPLALKVMGSSLLNQGLDGDGEAIWAEAIEAVKQSEDVMRVLRWSFDRLTESEKLMFMDITCLFDDHHVDEAHAFWESCKHSAAYVGLCTPYTSLRNLVSKNLIGTSESSGGLRKFEVHGLVRELGIKIAMNVKRHLVNDGFLVDGDKVETIGLNLVGCGKRKFKEKDFGNTSNLLCLRLPDGCKLDGGFKRVFKKLRTFQWRSMPLERLPPALSLRHVTSLDLSESTNLASIWTESNSSGEGFPNLYSLNLKGCTSLTTIPYALGQSLQIQHLNLWGCERLKKLPNFIGELKELKYLNLDFCKNLKTLPDTVSWPKLTWLSFFHCSSIRKLPKFLGQYPHLSSMSLVDCSSLKTLPDSVGRLEALRYLHLSNCGSLKTLPDSIGALTNLYVLSTKNCPLLFENPSSIKRLSRIMELNIGFDSMDVQVQDVQVQLQHLESSSNRWSFLEAGALGSLSVLRLQHDTLTNLPEAIGYLTSLEALTVRFCNSLEHLPNSIGELKLLSWLLLEDLPNLRSLPNNLGACAMLKNLALRGCGAITKLPWSVGLLSNLEGLELSYCTSLKRVPKSVGLLSNLYRLDLSGCTNLKRLPSSMGQLPSLKVFRVWDCGSIEAMGVLKIVHRLPIWGTTSITNLPPVSRLLVCDSFSTFSSWSYYDKWFSGSYEVLEEDGSGVLRAYHEDIDSSVPDTLLRIST